jgi:peptide deformylase
LLCDTVYGEIGVYNPEIVSYSEDNVTLEEGCLTFPLLFLNLTRPASIDVRYYKNDGIMVEDTFTGMDSRCYQHEYEHLQGELFIDRASNMKLQRAFTKREKLFKTLERQVK